MEKAHLKTGSDHIDERGALRFFNNFNMEEVVRFYEIAPSSTAIIRAWQAHKEEKKWFYCHSGSFMVKLFKIDDFENPSPGLAVETFALNESDPMILVVPGGYANGFKAQAEGSKLMVFSNFSVSESQKDDFRYPLDQWPIKW
ncbi:WxcM-like domain-containing protein [Maribacter algicola]|uniref:WxcM-like domain-containing protein n=1 Tax=Meishania litoralis TaxID=3434685 RepID=A0ACC7LIK0_9FLAO